MKMRGRRGEIPLGRELVDDGYLFCLGALIEEKEEEEGDADEGASAKVGV